MSKDQHPELEQLIDYMELPDSADQQTALHLARCSECRQHLSNLLNLREQLKSLATANNRSSQSALNSEEEKAIVGNSLSHEQLGRIKRDKHSLKAALYLSSQAHAMTAAASTTPPSAKPKLAEKSLLGRMTAWLSASMAAAPRWEYGAMAATLMLAVLLGFALFPQTKSSDIIAYSDNPVMVFKQIKHNTPGMGFFSDAVNVSQAYPGIQIQQNHAKQWLVTWPEVDNAKDYVLQMYQFDNGARKLLFEEKTHNSSSKIEHFALQSQHRYEWKLSGTTTDQRRFSASGGFVVR